MVEDDCFECDVIIESNRHCVSTLTKLFHELEQEGIEEPLRLKRDSLSVMDWHCIRRLYKEKEVSDLVEQVSEGLSECERMSDLPINEEACVRIRIRISISILNLLR